MRQAIIDGLNKTVLRDYKRGRMGMIGTEIYWATDDPKAIL
jgi:hypothetical protein